MPSIASTASVGVIAAISAVGVYGLTSSEANTSGSLTVFTTSGQEQTQLPDGITNDALAAAQEAHGATVEVDGVRITFAGCDGDTCTYATLGATGGGTSKSDAGLGALVAAIGAVAAAGAWALTDRRAPAAPVAPVVPVASLVVQDTRSESQLQALADRVIEVRDLSGGSTLGDRLAAGLDAAGFQAIDPTGQPFDPTYHRAVEAITTDGASAGTVASTERLGYYRDGVLVRPAEVVVYQEQP